MKKSKINFKIVEMHSHFLYLPIYYAKYKNFFNYLPDNYSIEIVQSYEATDSCVYKTLMDTATEKNREVAFAVCDPTCVLTETNVRSDASPAILAGVLTNAAFWAVDHSTHKISALKDLALFNKVISFHPGTTSYGIAMRALHEAKIGNKVRTPCIITVSPKQELVKLREEIGAIALSPDILGIEGLISGEEAYNIDMTIGTTPEYNNVLVTALLSRNDIVENHGELVAGLIRALQRSMLLVRFGYQDVTEYAKGRFQDFHSTNIENALKRAIDAEVFSTSIEISEAHWLNAAATSYYSTDSKPLSEKDKNKIKEDAEQRFYSFIKPYTQLTKRAINTEILPRLSLELMTTTNHHLFAFILVGILIGSTHLHLYNWTWALFLGLGVILEYFRIRFRWFSLSKKGQYIHWITLLILLFILPLLIEMRNDKNALLGIIGIVVTVVLSFVTNIFYKAANRT